MKKSSILFLFTLVCLITYGQTDSIDLNKIATYAYGTENIGFKVSLNENGDLQFIKIIDSLKLSKDELYNRVLSYFAYNYNDSKRVIQQQDKENGLIIAKGNFGAFSVSDFQMGNFLYPVTAIYEFRADHTVRVDIKNGKIRYILTIPEYNINLSFPSQLTSDTNTSNKISKCAPFFYDYSSLEKVPKISRKAVKKDIDNSIKADLKAFHDLCFISKTTIESFETSLKKGNTKEESKDW